MSPFVNAADLPILLRQRRAQRLSTNPVMQCRVCWYRYDPARGCPETQTPPATPFAALPDDWCCPQCGAPRDAFLADDPPS